jgi:hypothetical protein
VRGHKRPAATSSFSGSFTLVQRIQAAGGLLRTNIPMKSTILRIALANKKQVRRRARHPNRRSHCCAGPPGWAA